MRGESDLGKLSKQYSSKDMPSHTKLKYRQIGQNAPEEIRSRDLHRELHDRERSARSEKRSSDSSRSSRDVGSSKRSRMEALTNLDKDDPMDPLSDSSDSDSSDDDDEELQRELAKIRQERAQEAEKAEAERQVEEERIRAENILRGNPLIKNPGGGGGSSNFTVKRRWDDDVIFKNCARGVDEKPRQKFINDTLRSEFHKKFMDKYVK